MHRPPYSTGLFPHVAQKQPLLAPHNKIEKTCEVPLPPGYGLAARKRPAMEGRLGAAP